jgi:hypothetical protein
MKTTISAAVVGIILLLGFTLPQPQAKKPTELIKDTLYFKTLKVPDQKLVSELEHFKKNVVSFEVLVNDVKNTKVEVVETIIADTVSIQTDTVLVSVDTVKVEKKQGWLRRAIKKIIQ